MVSSLAEGARVALGIGGRIALDLTKGRGVTRGVFFQRVTETLLAARRWKKKQRLDLLVFLLF